MENSTLKNGWKWNWINYQNINSNSFALTFFLSLFFLVFSFFQFFSFFLVLIVTSLLFNALWILFYNIIHTIYSDFWCLYALCMSRNCLLLHSFAFCVLRHFSHHLVAIHHKIMLTILVIFDKYILFGQLTKQLFRWFVVQKAVKSLLKQLWPNKNIPRISEKTTTFFAFIDENEWKNERRRKWITCCFFYMMNEELFDK